MFAAILTFGPCYFLYIYNKENRNAMKMLEGSANVMLMVRRSCIREDDVHDTMCCGKSVWSPCPEEIVLSIIMPDWEYENCYLSYEHFHLYKLLKVLWDVFMFLQKKSVNLNANNNFATTNNVISDRLLLQMEHFSYVESHQSVCNFKKRWFCSPRAKSRGLGFFCSTFLYEIMF